MGRIIVARLLRRRRIAAAGHVPPPEQPNPPAPEQKGPAALRGWDDICGALEVSDTAAMGYAARDVDPLPVYYDHASRPCIRVAALQAWVDRQALFFRTYHVLRREGKLPGQVRTEGGKLPRPKRKRSIKPAVRARESD